ITERLALFNSLKKELEADDLNPYTELGASTLTTQIASYYSLRAELKRDLLALYEVHRPGPAMRRLVNCIVEAL
ncbi:MAG: hypothetical protein AB1753_06855, partial [Thermoproteota archaeon]